MGVGSVNMEAILQKAKDYMKTPKMQEKIWKKTDDYMIRGKPVVISSESQQRPAVQASGVFIKTFKKEVEDSAAAGYLGTTAVDALENMSETKPVRSGKRYYVQASIDGDGHRESLQPEEYDGVDNIAMLLNEGYEARIWIRGVWQGHNNGKKIWSRRVRPGAHFIEHAIETFKKNDAHQFGVIDIEVSTEE